MSSKIYLIYKIYTDGEMNYEFGRDWKEESRKQLYAWTASKRYKDIFRQTHKEKMFIYDSAVFDDDSPCDEFYKTYADKELHEVKLRYDYKLTPDEHIKVIMTDDEENKIDDAWGDIEVDLFNDHASIPSLSIFKEKYQELFDLLNLSFYWASMNYPDDDIVLVNDSKSYGIGPCGGYSPPLEANQFQLYVDTFDSILKGGNKH